MSGTRLGVGLVVMGILVPLTIFFFLELESFTELLGLSLILFLGWAITDFLTTLLSRPRLRDRSPGKAIAEWDSTRSE